jgi:hypothetical protein
LREWGIFYKLLQNGHNKTPPVVVVYTHLAC